MWFWILKNYIKTFINMKISLVNLSVWIQFGCIKSFEILSQQIIIYSHNIL